jgi:hypothetical protein
VLVIVVWLHSKSDQEKRPNERTFPADPRTQSGIIAWDSFRCSFAWFRGEPKLIYDCWRKNKDLDWDCAFEYFLVVKYIDGQAPTQNSADISIVGNQWSMGINPRLLLAGSHVVPGILSEGMARALREKSTISSTDLRVFDWSLLFPPTPRGSSLLAYSSSKCIMTVEKIEKRDWKTFRLISRHISQIPRDIAPRVSGHFLLSCPDPLEDFMFSPSALIFVLHPSLSPVLFPCPSLFYSSS